MRETNAGTKPAYHVHIFSLQPPHSTTKLRVLLRRLSQICLICFHLISAKMGKLSLTDIQRAMLNSVSENEFIPSAKQ